MSSSRAEDEPRVAVERADTIVAIDALNVRLSSTRCRIETPVAAEAEARDAASDGMWPPITRDRPLVRSEGDAFIRLAVLGSGRCS